ncbi:MAG: SdrD B-like domain-containing protein, partial [Pseudomonadota bacterium]
NPANNTATDSTTLTALADLSAAVTVTPQGTPGSVITATATFTNNGPSTAVNVTATVVKPDGTTQTLVIPSLPTGSSTVTVISYTVPAASTTVQTFNAAVTSTTADPTRANNTATASTSLNTIVDISTTLVVPTSAEPGSTVTANITVKNAGPSTAQNVTVSLTVPSGSITLVTTIPALPGGSSTVVSVVYKVPAAQSATMTWTATAVTTTPETTTANNIATATTLIARVANASLSGRVWLDANSDRTYTSGTDLDLAGWQVELLQNSVVIGSATTGVDGKYQIPSQVPGSGYSVRFKNPAGQVVVSTPFNQTVKTSGGNESTGVTTSVRTGTGYIVGGSIDNVTLYAGDNTIEQNLPIDPSGVVYDAVTRKPVKDAVVTLFGPDGQRVPDTNLLQGASQMTTGSDGIYQFDLLPTAPSGRYRLQVTAPAGYANTTAVLGGVALPQLSGTGYTPPTNVAFVFVQPGAQPPDPSVTGVQTPGAGSVGTVGTQYFLEFNLSIGAAGSSAGVLHNHIPLDPLTSGAILVSKVGDKTVAEVADSVRYTIRMRNTTGNSIASVSLEDLLPAGFRYIPGTSRLNNVALADPAGGIGRALTFGNIGTIPANTTFELSYYVRLGVGSQQGDGINRATAVFPGSNGAPVRSNTALFKVNVQGGVFSNEGCITGKVYVDCDGNAVQNNAGGSREVGIPGVRLVMLDGSFIITDPEGKYSVCGVKPQTHVIKVDRTTLPKGSRLVPSSNRNAGVGDSIFVDLKGGELARADFIEGSCSPEVMDQVKARRAQGAVSAPELENGLPLKIDNRPGEVQQQILPATRQQDLFPAGSGGVR